MPSWSQVAIRSADFTVEAPSTSLEVESDPNTWEQFGHASAARVFVDVEHLEPGSTLHFYRHLGSRADLMRKFDRLAPVLVIAATVGAVTTVASFDFPTPLASFGKVQMVLYRTGATPANATLRVLQCFDQG